MKSAKDLVSSSLYGPDAHKRMGANFKRLAGGIRNVIKSGEEFSTDDAKILAKAADLLEQASGVRASVAKIRSQEIKIRDTAAKQCERMLRDALASRSSPRDQLSLIFWQVPFMMEGKSVESRGAEQLRRDIQYALDLSFTHLGDECAREAMRGGDGRPPADSALKEVINRAMEKVPQKMAEAYTRHQAAIQAVLATL